MTLDVDLDTGPVHLERRVEIGEKTLATLLAELATLGAQALTEVLDSSELLANPHAQEGVATYAEKLTKEDFHLSASSRAEQNLRIVRLGQAFAVVAGRRILVEDASPYQGGEVAGGSIVLRDGRVAMGVADGAIVLERVRPESAKSMGAVAWWTGARFDQNVALWT
jgi:methionyl-tRNA formyltransferase